MDSMVMVALQGVGGLAALYFGGEWLVRGAAALALRMGVSALAVGLTVVAFGTSAPELVVSLQAALGGANDIAVGNVVGSNVANVGLILGLAALLRPARVEAKIVRLDGPLAVVVSLVLLAMLWGDTVTRAEGSVLLVGLATYVVFTFRQARRESRQVRGEFAAAAPAPTLAIGASVLFVAVGVATLVLGGHLLVSSAVVLATSLGISQAVIGLTVVAVGTSLPELATSVVAVLRGEGDIAVGNVVGSNLFNILGILGLTSAIHPLARGEIGWATLGVMVAFAVVLVPLLYTRLELSRFEGAALLLAYVAYVGWLAAG